MWLFLNVKDYGKYFFLFRFSDAFGTHLVKRQ